MVPRIKVSVKRTNEQTEDKRQSKSTQTTRGSAETFYMIRVRVCVCVCVCVYVCLCTYIYIRICTLQIHFHVSVKSKHDDRSIYMHIYTQSSSDSLDIFALCLYFRIASPSISLFAKLPLLSFFRCHSFLLWHIFSSFFTRILISVFLWAFYFQFRCQNFLSNSISFFKSWSCHVILFLVHLCSHNSISWFLITCVLISPSILLKISFLPTLAIYVYCSVYNRCYATTAK
jgi:hypothetical protein